MRRKKTEKQEGGRVKKGRGKKSNITNHDAISCNRLNGKEEKDIWL